MEIFHIAGYRIKTLRDLPWMKFLMAFPRILHIGILRSIVSFHLDMCRHINVFPVFAGICLCLKTLDRSCIVLCILEFPESVHVIAVRSLTIFSLFLRTVIGMVGMCRHSSIAEILRVFYQ